MEQMKVEGLAHVGLYVNDVKKSVAFYTEKLNFSLIHETVSKIREGDVLIRFIQNGNCVLELVQFPYKVNREDGWFDHISMEVKKLDEVIEALTEKGVAFEKDSYTIAPHVFPPKGSKWVFLRGPDGEHIELNERNERM